MDAAAAQHLASGNWPCLENLMLQDNTLDNTAIQWLVQGQWPHLSYLSLECNQFDAVGVQALTESNWYLVELSLDVSTASAATWSTLNLDAAYLSTFTAKAKNYASSVPRLLQWIPSNQVARWPGLYCVDFASTPSVYRQDGSRTEHKFNKQSDA